MFLQYALVPDFCKPTDIGRLANIGKMTNIGWLTNIHLFLQQARVPDLDSGELSSRNKSSA